MQGDGIRNQVAPSIYSSWGSKLDWHQRTEANIKPICIACFLLLFCWQSAAQSPQSADAEKNHEKCTVAGTVLRLDTGEPLKKATVILWNRNNGAESAFAVTDNLGHFQFGNLEASSYNLAASHNGFVKQEYGQRKPGDPGATLSLVAGQRITDLVFKLLRTASITGRVMDDDGRPLPKVEVMAYHAPSQYGKRRLWPAGGASTNDLGEYRIFDLNPGTYYVRANYEPWKEVRGINAASPQALKENYPPTFHHNTTDPAKAAAINVNAGDEIPSVDFLLTPSRVVTVSGKVYNAITRHTDNHVRLTLRPRGIVESGYVLTPEVIWNKEGQFEIRDVFPGNYIIEAGWERNQESGSAQRDLEVGNSDVGGVNLTISPGVDVSGHLVWEEKPPGEVQGAEVALNNSNKWPDSWNSGAYEVKPDGSFVIKNVQEGVYRPHVFTGSWDCFLKSARNGLADVTDGDLAVHPGTHDSLELTVSCRAARIDGVVMTEDLLPVAGAFVVAIPNVPYRDEEWKYSQGVTDQNGQFQLRGLVPGDYRIFSWDSVDDFDYYDQEQLKPYESKGLPISVQQGDRKKVQLTLNEIKNASQARQ
jgi:protocatechuate 3,4-dioxygenase beta subunit